MADASRLSIRVIAAVALLAALAAAFGAGRASVARQAPSVLPSPTRILEGVSLGFPHTIAGAEAAAAHYLLELERAMDTLDPRRTVAVASLLATSAEAQAIGTHAGSVIGLESSDGAPARRVAISTDPISYSTQAAQVTVLEAWLYARTDQEAVWAIERVSLVWQQGDWRVAAIDGAAPSSNESLAELHAQLEFPGAGDASVR
jgi:hypothetical protein